MLECVAETASAIKLEHAPRRLALSIEVVMIAVTGFPGDDAIEHARIYAVRHRGGVDDPLYVASASRPDRR